MNNKVKGFIFGIIAAVSYGTNPLGALSLDEMGVNVNSMVFYRYTIAIAILALLMIYKKISFRITKRELAISGILGILFSVSSLTLYDSFNYMDAGIASTILFVYPIMVAVIMMVFFKEKTNISTLLAITLALCGIAMLNKGENGSVMNPTGICLVLLSSLSYAIYIVIINKASLKLQSFKMTFYVLLFGTITTVVNMATNPSNHIHLLPFISAWGYATLLALLPTILSLVFMTKAIRLIGSVPAAIMGALEPITAVAIGVIMFGEIFTLRLAIGIAFILVAVLLVIAEQPKIIFKHIVSLLSVHNKH